MRKKANALKFILIFGVMLNFDDDVYFPLCPIYSIFSQQFFLIKVVSCLVIYFSTIFGQLHLSKHANNQLRS